jgi:hypothetical protein
MNQPRSVVTALLIVCRLFAITFFVLERHMDPSSHATITFLSQEFGKSDDIPDQDWFMNYAVVKWLTA